MWVNDRAERVAGFIQLYRLLLIYVFGTQIHQWSIHIVIHTSHKKCNNGRNMQYLVMLLQQQNWVEAKKIRNNQQSKEVFLLYWPWREPVQCQNKKWGTKQHNVLVLCSSAEVNMRLHQVNINRRNDYRCWNLFKCTYEHVTAASANQCSFSLQCFSSRFIWGPCDLWPLKSNQLIFESTTGQFEEIP